MTDKQREWLVVMADGLTDRIHAEGWEVLRSGALWFWDLTDATPVGPVTVKLLAGREWRQMNEVV